MTIPLGWIESMWKWILAVILTPLALYVGGLVLTRLKFWGEYGVEGVLYWINTKVLHSFAASLSLKRYSRLQLGDITRFLRVPGFRTIQVDIDGVFVPLTLEEQNASRTTYSQDTLLKAGSRLMVIGDPGSGKSSLLKRIMRDAARAAMRDPHKARLPVLVELRSVIIPGDTKDDQLGGWLYREIKRRAAESDVYRMDECFDNYTRTTGLLVLLDGLDEVATSQYARMRDALNGLCQQLDRSGDHNVVLITARIQYYVQVRQDYEDSFPVVMALRPFTPSDIYEFLTRWQFASDRDKQIARIYGELTDRPTLREMCSNPLVLSMYVAADQAGGYAAGADTRTDFYEKVTEELLTRRERQGGQTAARKVLREKRQRVLGRIAYEHLLDPSQPANSLQWDAATKCTRASLECTSDEAEAELREIAKDTGLVTEERTGESLRFIHLTFCEFFAASYAVQNAEDGWGTLVSTYRQFQQAEEPQVRTRLTEVIPFACGLLPPRLAPEAMEDVAALEEWHLQARVFLETKLYGHYTWLAFRQMARDALLSVPESDWTSDWLRDLHLFNTVVGDAKESAAHGVGQVEGLDLTQFYQALAAKQQQSMAKLVAAYARQDAAAAFRLAEVCRLDLAGSFPEVVIENLDQRPFAGLVWQRAMQEPERVGLWASLLAESGLRYPVVASWLAEDGPISQWQPLVLAVPKKRRWWGARPLPNVRWMQVLTIAAGQDEESCNACSFLRLVRKMQAPGSMRLLRRPVSTVVDFGNVMLMAIIGAATVLVAYDQARVEQLLLTPEGTMLGLVGVFLGLGFLVALITKEAFQDAYQEVIWPGFRRSMSPQRWLRIVSAPRVVQQPPGGLFMALLQRVVVGMYLVEGLLVFWPGLLLNRALFRQIGELEEMRGTTASRPSPMGVFFGGHRVIKYFGGVPAQKGQDDGA